MFSARGAPRCASLPSAALAVDRRALRHPVREGHVPAAVSEKRVPRSRVPGRVHRHRLRGSRPRDVPESARASAGGRSTNGRMPPCRRYSRSRGVSSRTRAAELLVVGAHRHLARLAVLDAADRERLAPGEPERLAASRRRRNCSGRIPIISRFERWMRSYDSRSPPARRAGSAPSPPSRATSPSRTPCRRARSAACPRRGSARDASKIVISSPDGTCTVHVPSEPGTSWLRRRTFANVPRTITSWLPRRAPYELKSLRSTPCSTRYAPGGRVGPDRAGRRDVVGRDRVAEPDEARARPRCPPTVPGSRVIPSKYGGCRTYVESGSHAKSSPFGNRQRAPRARRR